MSDYPLVPTPLDPEQALATAGQIANQYAAQGAFADYLSRQSDNRLRAHVTHQSQSARYAYFGGSDDYPSGDQ